MTSKTITVTTIVPIDKTSGITFKINGNLPAGDYQAKICDVREANDIVEITSHIVIEEDDCPFKSILHEIEDVFNNR